ncbi:MAG: HD-GYP domain-containing protein, partial [Candidatus Krumholzibacteria bacterium]|nr:HD-GYP domain-containing protein [Candidatus Krumholzibacteria bacterium]
MERLDQQIRVLLYEYSMAIGADLELKPMLRSSLSILMRHLNCSGGVVFQFSDREEEDLEPVISIPRNLCHTSRSDDIRAMLLKKSRTEQVPDLFLPEGNESADSSSYVLPLSDFGYLVLFKSGERLREQILKSLQPMNRKLAAACHACVQAEATGRSHQEMLRAHRELLSKTSELESSRMALLNMMEDMRGRDQALKESYEGLKRAMMGTVEAMAVAVEHRDPYTAGHQKRVALLAEAIAREMGLDLHTIEGIRLGATVHDLGKIRVPAEILNKPGRLTPQEFEIIKIHPEAGYEILKGVDFPWPIAEIAHQHQERMDGSGYPQGLIGEEICLEARIVSVADVCEAISSHRPYRPARGLEEAVEHLREYRGVWFYAEAVDVCLKLLGKGFRFD